MSARKDSPKVRIFGVVAGLGLVLLTLQPAVGFAQAERPEDLAKKSDAGEVEPPFRLSLPTMEDKEAWLRPGFRLQLGYAYGGLHGVAGTPGGTTHAAVVRVGARLDERWSLLATLSYAGAVSDELPTGASSGLNGLRFLGTLDPTWHPTPSTSIALGAGFGGIVEGFTGREDLDAKLNGELVAPYTHADTNNPLPTCVGIGAGALLRGSYDYVLGPTSSIGLQVQGDATYTSCEMNLNRVEPDTANEIMRRQYWTTLGVSAGVLVMWR